jgi:hypothetical protein
MVEFLFPALKGMLPDGHERDEVARRPAPAPPAVQDQQTLLGIRLRGGLGLLAGQPAAPANLRPVSCQVLAMDKRPGGPRLLRPAPAPGQR